MGYKGSDKSLKETMPYTAQASSNYSSACLLPTVSKIYAFDFSTFLLVAFNLQKLMQSNFREDAYFGIK